MYTSMFLELQVEFTIYDQYILIQGNLKIANKFKSF